MNRDGSITLELATASRGPHSITTIDANEWTNGHATPNGTTTVTIHG